MTTSEAKNAICNRGASLAIGMAPTDKEAACQSAVDQCLAAQSQAGAGGVPDGAEDANECANAKQQLENCPAKVGECEACKNATAQEQRNAFKASVSMTCAQLVAAAENPAAAVTLPACKAANGKVCGQG